MWKTELRHADPVGYTTPVTVASVLLTAEQAEAICPACLGSGSRADELKLEPDSTEHAAAAAVPCATCRGFGTLAPLSRVAAAR